MYVPEMSSTTFSIATVLAPICQAAMSIPHTERGALWFVVGLLGFWGWVAVVTVFLVWGAIELISRYGSSANGCTPLFNTMVGSLTFTVFESLIALVFGTLFGKGIYCTPIPYTFYAIAFPSTWLFLVAIGFWVY